MKGNAQQAFPDGRTAELADAAAAGDGAAVRRLVLDGANPNAVGVQGLTPLVWALFHKNPAGMKALLEAGSKPGYRASNGQSALAVAAGTKDGEYLRLLLDHRADPNLLDENGEPVIFRAIAQRAWDNLRLLLDRGADIDAVGRYGHTPMMRLATLSEFEQVAHLLSRKADFRKADDNDATVAYRVQSNLVDPRSPEVKWRDRVREMLEARGVKFPVEGPRADTGSGSSSA